jgi:fibronectin-binding autotransporter adhesin
VPVTVTINGADDAPVVVGETNPPVQTVILAGDHATHTAGLSTEMFDHQQPGSAPNNDHVKLSHAIAGTLTVSDKDVGDTLTAKAIGDATVKYNGSSHLPDNVDVDALIDKSAITFDHVTSDGKPDVLQWTYDPAGANLDFLKPGDTLTITYQAQVNDGHGGVDTQPLTITIKGNGSSVVNGTAQDDTFDHVGGGATIFGKGGNDTFVFNKGFGSATIGDFDANKDTIELDHSLFKSIQDILNSAHAANGGHDTVITDAAHDTITLKGVMLAQLQHHQNDFHIV